MLLASTSRSVVFRGRACRRSVFGWPSWNKEKSAQKKQQLKEEFDKGFVSELREYRKNSGKLYHAQNSLVPKDQASMFPQVNGCSLAGTALSLPRSQPSLVLVSLTGSGMMMCEKYRKPLETEFSGKIGVVEVSLLEKAIYVMMRNWIEHNLKRDVPTDRHSDFLLCVGKIASELRKALSIHSSIVGYVYLLDEDGLIRWQAHAAPTQEELQSMATCTRELIT